MDHASAPPSNPSSERIISHNLHLLNDSYDAQETGSIPSQRKPFNDGPLQGDPPTSPGSAMEVKNSMGGESPRVAQPDAGSRYPDQYRDSLDDRPASNSSADSRGMDDSPVDKISGDSKESLTAEKQYQDDLKERVRQSFKDLGMEPEGVLRDSLEESNQSAKRKKRHPASKRQPAPKSSGSGPQDDIGEDDVRDEPSDYANEPASYEDEPAGYADEQEHPDGEDNQMPRRCPSEGIENSNPTEDYPRDHEYSNASNQGGMTPVRQPEEREDVENHGYPENYPVQDQYEDEYGNNPPAEEKSDAPKAYPVEDELSDDDTNAPGVQPEGDNYPESYGYPNGDGYPEASAYLAEGGYLEEGNYPPGGDYPEGDTYKDSAPHEHAYPPNSDESNYPNESTPVLPSGFPSRYDNQGYADDEEQYEDRNQAPNAPRDNEPFDETPKDSLDYGQPAGVSNATPTDSLDYDEPGDPSKNGNAQDFSSHQEAGSYPQDSLNFGYAEPSREPSHPSDARRYDETFDDTHSRGDDDPAPYDSLNDHHKVPNKTPIQEVSRDPDEHSVNDPRENKSEKGSSGKHQPLVVSHLQGDAAERNGYSSNNSSANSSREIPSGSSAGPTKHSRSRGSPSARGSPGLQDRSPQGKRTTPSRSGSRGLGSGGSNHSGYSDLARHRGSAHQNGSAGSNKNSEGRSPPQNHQPQSGSLSGNQNRGRSLSNRVKTTPIPADELSAKELLKRTRSKSDAVGERPKVEHSDSQIIRKNGEEVRVAYISDDSGDEGEHFLDEKGSPVDFFGKPLYKDLHGTQKKPEEPKFEFRIKPTPPKQKSPLELQVVNARRTSADDGRGSNSANKAPHGGKITIAKPFPVEEPVIEKTVAIQTGLLDNALPPQEIVQEQVIQKTSAQQEGVIESSLPPHLQDRSTQKEETDSPSGGASNSRTPFGEVKLRSVGTVMSGKSMGRRRTRPVPETTKEDPYRDLRFETDAAEQHARENKASIDDAINRDLKAEEQKSAKNHTPLQVGKPLGSTYKEDFAKQEANPPASRSASGASYQDRGIQYTPQEGQRREQQISSRPQHRPEPVVQHPYNVQQQGYLVQQQDEYDSQQQHQFYPNAFSQSAFSQQPGFPSAPLQPSQYNADGYPVQQSWEQQPHGGPWNSAQPPQVPQQFYSRDQPVPVQYGHHYQEVHNNQQHPGYIAPLENPNFQQPDKGQYYDQQQPYDATYQNHPSAPMQHARAAPADPSQGYISPSQVPQTVYPNQGVQPALGFYPNHSQPVQNEPPRQRAPPKPKPNFIDLNKANLARGPPRRKYSEMQKKMPTPTRINPKRPLPDISRESSQYDDPSAEEGHILGSAQTWAHEDWTQQLIHDQRSLPMRRGHSDTNLYIQNAGPGPVPQGYHPQGYHPQDLALTSVPGYSDEAIGRGYSQDPRAYHPAYNQTYPPQMARNLNGQPYSYSADHATQFARNNGFARPQLSGPPRARVAFADDYHNSFDSDVNPMIYANEGADTGYQHATKRTSPYHVLPDIPGYPKSDGTSPLRKSDPDSYMARLLKQKQPPQYKEYTLKDYRNLKKDIRLGGLGPDPDLITEKQEKVNRQRDYAKAVMQQNKKRLQQTNRLWPNDAVMPQESTPSKRDIAIEYSKTIPKPRVLTSPEELYEHPYGASSRQQAQEEAEHEERTASEMARLEELRARHEKEKEEVEKLKAEGAS